MENGASAIVVEKDNHRLSLWRSDRGRPVLVKSYQATTGKGIGDKRREGDERTPEGIYFFTKFIDGSRLPGEYGVGAIVMDYPNIVDLLEGNDGDGIWLHATDDPDRVQEPYTTRGCVVVRNEHLLELKRSIVLSYTPIVVGRTIRMVPEEEVATVRSSIENMVNQWVTAWNRGDVDRYLAFYDRRFRGGGMNLPQFIAHKRSVFARSSGIRVGLGDMQVYRLGNQAVAHFFQDYSSSLTSRSSFKTMHLLRADSGWKIVGEESESLSSYRGYPSVLARARATTPGPPAVLTAATTSKPADQQAATSTASAPPKPVPGETQPLPVSLQKTTETTRPAITLLGTDTRVVSVQSLQSASGAAGMVEVNFELRNTRPGITRVTGRLGVIMNLREGEDVRRLYYPPIQQGTRGISTADLAVKGEYFSVQRFKVVRALFDVPEELRTSGGTIKICVYDRSGKPLLIKDYPLNQLRWPASGEATASLSWKAKS
ncbi:MAG: L,D-transpeptidase family protein [Acidobacteriota bacterium]